MGLEGGDPPLPLFHRLETAVPAWPADCDSSIKWLPGRGLPIDEGKLSKGHIKAGRGAFRKAIYEIKQNKKVCGGQLWLLLPLSPHHQHNQTRPGHWCSSLSNEVCSQLRGAGDCGRGQTCSPQALWREEPGDFRDKCPVSFLLTPSTSVPAVSTD